MSFKRAKVKQRALRRQMQKMGMQTENIEGVTEVIIRTETNETVIPQPQVQLTKMGEQDVYSVIGQGETRDLTSSVKAEASEEIEVNEADIQLVAQQANVSPEDARQALLDTGGDLARAILLAKNQ